jgi:hypothetical protein
MERRGKEEEEEQGRSMAIANNCHASPLHVQARMRHERRLQNSRARTCADIFMFQRPRYCRKRGYGMLDCAAKGSDREGKGNEVEPGSLGINPPPGGEPPG